MIDPKEIRLGNLIIDCGIDYDAGGNKVRDRDGDEIITVDIDTIKDCIAYSAHYDGIPLTPEWLERFGFERGDAYDISHTLERGEENYWRNDRLIWHHRLQNKSTCETYEHIQFVHQVQNLYFALTGEELQIKFHEIQGKSQSK